MRVELCLLAIVPLRLAFTGVRLGPVASSVLWQTVDGAGLVVSEGRAPTASQDVERFFSLASAGPSTGTAVIEGVKAHGRTLLVEAKRPSPRDEAWRFTNLKTFFEPQYTLASPGILSAAEVAAFVEPSCEQSFLVIADGVYRPELSRPPSQAGVHVLSLANMSPLHPLYAQLTDEVLYHMPDAGELPRDALGSDALVALAAAAARDVLVLVVDAGVEAERPLQVLVCGTSAQAYCQTRLAVLAGEGSSLSLKQSLVSLSGESTAEELVCCNTRVLLGRGARLQHAYAQELSLNSRHVEVLSAEVPANALYTLTTLLTGARIGRVNAYVNLNEPDANCTVNGVILAHTRQSLDLHSSISHLAPSTTSSQTQRNVIGDRGEVIFKGRIRIPRVADKAASEQLCRSLMLGDRARLVAMPTLEITADDITCSHGAAVCDLDENAMFYLSARGINRAEARKLLLRSFVLELLDGDTAGTASLGRVISKLESMNSESVDPSSRKMESL